MTKRPVSITLIGWLFILVGCGSFTSHTWRFVSDAMRAAGASGHDVRDLVYAQISAVLAFTGGAGVLSGRTWARWVCTIWLAAHVALSMMHSLPETVLHAVFLVAIAYILLRPRAAAYFRGIRAEPHVPAG